MPDIILTTLNAKYAHCAFGLRYLMANLGDLQPRTKMIEFDINQRTLDVTERILAHEPQIVGIGVYIWNAAQSAELVANLKRLRPNLTVIVGGPEVSYEVEQQPICHEADYVITKAALSAIVPCQRPTLHAPRSFPLPRPSSIVSPCPTTCTPPKTSRTG